MDTDSGELSLGELLRRHRFRVGFSQGELAQRAGISVRAVRYIEQGRVARPQASSLRRLVEALELTESEQRAILGAASAVSTAVPAGDALRRPAVPAGAVPPAGGPVEGAAVSSRVGVLGPLTLHRGDTPVDIESSMLRDLLGLLAIQPGQVITPEEIVDVLWGDSPPRTCLPLIHTYVGQLRRLLEPGRARRAPAVVLLRTRGGYRLDLDAEGLDLAAFDELVVQARAAWTRGDPRAAWELYGRAWARWRGSLVADGGARLRQHPVAVAISGRRVAAVLDRADLGLSLGLADQVIESLRILVAEQPWHERLAGRLMLALAGCGQQAAALELFDTVRGRLDAELGVEPGEDLRHARLEVLRGLSVSTVESAGADRGQVPAQLPAAVAAFTGRAAYLRRLDDLLPAPTATTRSATARPATTRSATIRPVTAPAILMIVGMGGVGKSALAVQWAHRVRDRFPDGQLYANLRGHAGSPPLRPIEALVGLLGALGVPARQVPDDVAQASALWRSHLADRRVLVLLDDAATAEQVRPLLPGGAGSLVLVTSRARLDGLTAREGARRLALAALTPDESVILVRRMLGAERVGAQPAAIAELAGLCAHLPLALRIAGANLAGRPRQRVGDYVARLRAGNRLAALAVDGDADTAVRAAFALSYAALPAAESQMFRWLGLLPGADLTADAAAELAGITPVEAEALLERLAGRHLIEERAHGRYGLHDLLRLYAAELVEAGDGAAERRRASARLVQHYLGAVRGGAELLYPHMLHLPESTGREPVTPFTGADGARAWLDAERANVVAAIVRLGADGDPAAYQLADVLQGYLRLRCNVVDWNTVSTAALAAARATGDLRAQAGAYLSIGTVHYLQSRIQQAGDCYARSLELSERSGWTACTAVTLNNFALLHTVSGRPEETIGYLTRALALHRQTGRLAGEAVTLANLGSAHLDCATRTQPAGRALDGRAQDGGPVGTHLDDALRYLSEALELHRRLGDRRNEADTLRVLAAIHLAAGREAQALDLAEGALALARQTADRRFEMLALNTLATVYIRLGRRRSAVDHHQQALRLVDEVGDPGLHAQILTDLAWTCVRLGERDQARRYAQDALAISRRVGYKLIEQQAWRVLYEPTIAEAPVAV